MDATREMADGCLLLLWMNGVVRVEENAQACRARWRGKGICWARIKGILIFLGPKGSETTEGRLTTTRHWQQEDSMLDCWMRREEGGRPTGSAGRGQDEMLFDGGEEVKGPGAVVVRGFKVNGCRESCGREREKQQRR